MSRARPAVLQTAVETETAEGGRTRAWSDAATVWVELRAAAASAQAAQELRPVRVETATAVARDHLAAAAGQRLVVEDDPPWRVLAVAREAPAPGWMTLALDREG